METQDDQEAVRWIREAQKLLGEADTSWDRVLHQPEEIVRYKANTGASVEEMENLLNFLQANLNALSPWETEFLENITLYFQKGKHLSPKQFECLTRMKSKLNPKAPVRIKPKNDITL